jgi:hypothetical protein
MKKLYFFSLLLSFSISFNAQITGRVVDSKQQPVEYATVILQTIDSVYVNSTMTDTLGVFHLESGKNNYRILIQHLLYHNNVIETQETNIGTITMSEKENTLKDIVIKGERPFVKLDNGRITYNMENLLNDRIVSNAYESLLQIPGIREQDGKLVLTGARNVSVIINGRYSTMTGNQLAEMLQNIPQSRVEKVEIMYSAPPQYHVKGSVINILLTRNNDSSKKIQGQINLGYTQKYYDNYSGGINLLYSLPKIRFDLLYSLNQAKFRSDMKIKSSHIFENSLYEIEQSNDGSSIKKSHNIRFGTEYDISEKNSLNIIYTSQLTPTLNKHSYSLGSYSNTRSNRKLDKPTQLHNIDVNYNSKTGLNLGLNYTYYKVHSLQDVQSLNNEEEVS